MVQYLLKRDGQNSASPEGVTPLMVALKEGNTEVCQLVLDSNKDELSKKDYEDKHVFHHAFESKKPVDV